MIRLAFFPFLLPTLAAAAGWTDIYGTNARGVEVRITNQQNVTVQKQGDEEAYVQHFTADVIVKADGKERMFQKQNCIASSRPKGDGWISCSAQEYSPLAGLTYHQPPPKSGKLSSWRCVGGCADTAPKIMNQDSWE